MKQKYFITIFCAGILFSSIHSAAQSKTDKEAFRAAFIQVFENRSNEFESIKKTNVIVNGSYGFDATIKLPGADKCYIESDLYANKYFAAYLFNNNDEAIVFLNTVKDMLNYAASAYKARVVFMPLYGNTSVLQFYLSDSSGFVDSENFLRISKNTTKQATEKPFSVLLEISSKSGIAYYTNAGNKISNPAINNLIKEVGFGNDLQMSKIKKNKKTSGYGYVYESIRSIKGYKASILENTDEYHSEYKLELTTKWIGQVKEVNQKVDSLIFNLNSSLPASYCYRIDTDRQTVFFYQHPFTNELSDANFAIVYGLNEGQKNSYFVSLVITRSVEKEEDVKIKVEEKKLYPFKDASGKYGYKDQSGKIVVAAKYDKAEDFTEERGRVELNKKYGFVDISGKELIPTQYDYASLFITDGLTEVRLNGRYGLIDKAGKIAIPIQYDEIDRGGLYYNEKGDFHRRTKFILVKQNGKYGFVDSAGRQIVPLKYDYAHIIENMIARVKLNNKEGVIDYTRKEIVPIVYDAMNTDEYSKLGIIKVKQNGKWGLVDKSGKLIIAANYDYTADGFSEGLAWVRLNDKAGFVDKSGKEIIPLKYNGVGNFSNGLASARLNEKCGYIDMTGKEIIAFKYENGGSFAQGLAAVKINGKWGYIDKTGKTVIPFKYDGAEEFDKNGEAKVYIGKKWGKINKKGEIVKTIVNENDEDDWEY